ncbi:MAG TPA: zinc-dependent metalloprotease family protein [Flavobacterium sp.]|jgi:subtilisin-like proprotein convertase family protein
MKKVVLLLTLALTFGVATAQKGSAWSKTGQEKVAGRETVKQGPYSENQQLFQFDETAFRQSLLNVAERSSGQNGIEIMLPVAAGGFEKFTVWETSNFAPGLRAQFPEIKSYVGKGVTDRTAYLAFSLSPSGVQTMILRGDKGSEFIEPYTTDNSVYVLFDSRTRTKGSLPFTCHTDDVALNQELLTSVSAKANNQVFKTFRLALSCTGEYGAYFGGTVTGALAAMNATMTRVNGVFDKDMALKLEMIENNNMVVYTNAATDPYSAAPAGTSGAWNTELQSNLNTVIGSANYDIGHLFGASGGGGNAGCIGCVCAAGKGSGYTSPADGIPMGDNFDIDYVVHEMGHQLGANHTFSHAVEGSGVNIEPGSGSTIMGYAGITSYDVQSHSDAYFAYRSILQVQTNLALPAHSCSVNVPLSNNPPTINAGADYTIPKGTAFVLRGSGTDPNGDAITYNWEQNDNATNAVTGANSVASPTKTVGPNFRSVMPGTSPDRYMPTSNLVLNGVLSSTWESVSTVGRTLNFTLTGRDNVPGAGQTNTDAMVVTVSPLAGPFALTSQNTSGISWTQGASQAITWSVNNTSVLTGSANVNIKLSTDGGVTWPITLAANTPNDGNETITVPNVAAVNCRIMIEPTGNIFYAVNSQSFAIGYIITNTCNTYTNTTAMPVPDGVGANLPGATVASTINVPENNNITDVNVTVNGVHTYFWDMIVTLNHPDGTPARLLNRNCNQVSTGFNVTFNDGSPALACAAALNGTFAPNQPLSAFNNKPSNGNWTLTANDNYNGDTGTINSWSMVICSQTATLANHEVGLAEFAVYPNPNSGNFNIQFNSTSTTGVKVFVHDMRGRAIFENSYAAAAAFNENIQLHNAQSGIYLLTVTDGERKEVKKIVIQ